MHPALDLNSPKDAKEYIRAWVEQGALSIDEGGMNPTILQDGTDEDLLRVAKQLFMFCDPRPAQGATCGRH